MRADMRNKITIQQLSSSQDDYGESTKQWSDFKVDVWASKEQLLGKEYFQAESYQSKVEVKFRCYYFAGVKNSMRIICDGETYEILSAINVKSLNRELLLYARRLEVDGEV